MKKIILIVLLGIVISFSGSDKVFGQAPSNPFDQSSSANYCNSPTGTKYPNSPKIYPSEATSFGNDKLCKDGDPIPTYVQFPERGKTVSWTCKNKNGTAEMQCYAKRNDVVIIASTPKAINTTPASTFSCTGDISGNSVMCSGEDQGLTANIAKTLVPNCTDNNKCEHICKEGYELRETCVRSDNDDENNATNLCGFAPSPYTELCPGDDQGLGNDSYQAYLFPSCTNVRKCEYVCKVGYTFKESDNPRIIEGRSCVPNTSTISNYPQCGTASGKTYEATSTNFGNDTLCANGIASPLAPAFPTEGKTTEWRCSQSGNWIADSFLLRKVVSCVSARKSISVSSGCGTASGNYLATDTNFRSNNFCASGFNLSSAVPIFSTTSGSSVDWVCRPSFLNRLFTEKAPVVCSAKKIDNGSSTPIISEDCNKDTCDLSTHECIPKIYSPVRIKDTLNKIASGTKSEADSSNSYFYNVFNLYKKVGTNWDYKTNFNSLSMSSLERFTRDDIKNYIEEFKDKSPGDPESSYLDIYQEIDGAVIDEEEMMLSGMHNNLYSTNNLSNSEIVKKYNEIIDNTKKCVGQAEFDYMRSALSDFKKDNFKNLTYFRFQGKNQSYGFNDYRVLYKGAAGWKDTFTANAYENYLYRSACEISPQEIFVKKEIGFVMNGVAHFSQENTIDYFPANLAFWAKPGFSGITGDSLFKVYIPPGVLAIETWPTNYEISGAENRKYAVRLGAPPSGDGCGGINFFRGGEFATEPVSLILDSGAEVYLDSYGGDYLKILLDLDKTLNRQGQYLYIKKCEPRLDNLKYFVNLWYSPDIVLHQTMSLEKYTEDTIDKEKVCSSKSIHSTTIPTTGNECDEIKDYDKDGYNCSVDCDDYNKNINPGIAESINSKDGKYICYDNIDNDCDGLIDTRESSCPICTGNPPTKLFGQSEIAYVKGSEGQGEWTYVEREPGICQWSCKSGLKKEGQGCVRKAD